MQLRSTKDIYHHLSSLGLTLNESEVYIYLLKNGLTLGSTIHKDLKMDKSSAYRALNTLLEVNLVYKVGESRNQKFGANPEENLLSIVEAQKSKLDETSKHLKSFVKNIRSQSNSSFKKKNITIFEGEEGFKLFMEARLLSKEKLIREIESTKLAETFFNNIQDHDDFIESYIKRRIENKIFLKGLVINPEENTKFDVTSEKWLKELRILPKSFDVTATFTTWDSYLGIYSKDGNEIICVLINDSLVSHMFNQMFELIWGQSKPIMNKKE